MKALVILPLILLSLITQAQTAEEFLKQKATQKKYLLQQLAALKLYAGYLKKGYDFIDKGVTSIKGFTNGEFNLHSAFFKSLKLVNPIISGNKKVDEILSWQFNIKRLLSSFAAKSNFSSGEKSYFESIRAKILSECDHDLEELYLVVSDDKLELKDEERMRRLNALHVNMQDKYLFTKSFIDKAETLSLQRLQEDRNNQASKKVHGITK